MLSPNTILIDMGAAKHPAVCILSDDKLALFYDALTFAENVHATPAAIGAALQRHLCDGAVQFWHLYDLARCVAVAEDMRNSESVRVFAAALAINRVLPGSHGATDGNDKHEDGGTKARLIKPRPRLPSGGAGWLMRRRLLITTVYC